MASGVAISDEVLTTYDSIRVRTQGDSVRDRYKLVILRISDDQKNIIVDHKNCLKVKDLENTEDVFKAVINALPTNECRYAVYDCTYETKESVKEDLVFIFSAPETAPIKTKMLYASSKGALKAKLQGMKFQWQINDHSDRNASPLLEILGQKLVKSLEGKSV